MRISDWSSDVCSSDLATPEPRRAPLATAGGASSFLPPPQRRHSRRWRYHPGHFPARSKRRKITVPGRDDQRQHFAGRQIGRASCREKGCQNVEITVVDGTLKKKK